MKPLDPESRRQCEELLQEHANKLTDWEYNFISDRLFRDRALTDRQEEKLTEIYMNITAGGW